LLDAAAALGPTPEQTADALDYLLGWIDADQPSHYSTIEDVAKAVAAFGPTSEQATDTLARLTSVVAVLDATPEQAAAMVVPVDEQSKSAFVAALARATAALGPTPEQATPILARLLDRLHEERDWYELRNLAQAAAELGPRLGSGQAAATLTILLDRLLEAPSSLPDRVDTHVALAQAVAALGPTKEQTSAMLGLVLDLLRDMGRLTNRQMAEVVDAAAALGLAAEQSEAVLGPLLERLHAERDPDSLNALAKAAATLAPRLEQDRRGEMLSLARASIAWARTTNPPRIYLT
jgi:hypothetical protein